MANGAPNSSVRNFSYSTTPPADHPSAADVSDEDDSFERKLKEMLKDSGTTRSSVSVHGDISSEMTFIGGADSRQEYRGGSQGVFDGVSPGEHVQRPTTMPSSTSAGFNTTAHNSAPRQPGTVTLIIIFNTLCTPSKRVRGYFNYGNL